MKVFVTVDVEEWYHLEYIKKYIDKIGSIRVVPKMNNFINILEKMNIKATFFILGELVNENKDLLKRIANNGHEIACHGLDHDLLYDKSNEEFFGQIIKAKADIEYITNKSVKGYRASCFSMENEKLELLKKAGFTYDSSYIKFEQHGLYKILDLNKFEKKESLVYSDGVLNEYEIPTLKLGKYNIPISGGGYIRLFPFWLMKIFIKKYAKKEENFLLYLHPFELTNIDIPISSEIPKKDKFRMNIGRKRNIIKVIKLLKYLKSKGAVFCTLN